MVAHSRSCKEAADALMKCILKSDCIYSGKSIQDCIPIVEDCSPLRIAYVRCKHSVFDTRSRIRGPKGG